MAAKVESTPGTAVTLGVADAAINAYDVEIQTDIEVEERECQGSFNRLGGSPGARGATMTFKCDMGWDGTGHPFWATVLWPACGLAATSDVYNPVSEVPHEGNVSTITMGVYENGLLKQMRGCMGNCKITGTAGMMGMMEFEFKGVWIGASDTAIVDPTYPQDLPARFAGQDFTWQSVDQVVESIEFDFGNNVILRESAAEDEGFLSALITDRYPKVTGNPESRLVADDDKFGDLVLGSEGALVFGFTGPKGTSTDGKIVVSAPKAQLLSVQESDRNKFRSMMLNGV